MKSTNMKLGERVILLIVIATGVIILSGCQKETPRDLTNVKSISMKIASPAFENNGNIPAKFTCDGENVNPPLAFSEVPPDAKSLAVIVDDPDAPAGDWAHWTVWNIDPKTNAINENSVPENATEGITDFGNAGYGGPCPPRVDSPRFGEAGEAFPRVEAGPPSGTHRYQFKAYALGVTLNLDSSAKKKDIESAMEAHILDRAMLTGLYRRQ